MHADLLVIGGGPAGLAAARGYRDQGGAGAVLVVSADTAPPYDRPPLSKDYLRGEADERDLPMAVRYGTGGVVVGVATHEADDDYERGQRLVEEGGRF
jgi:3-phenylpropionate/trans-cinnamate dioxygenase ferredoxin reductase subunit